MATIKRIASFLASPDWTSGEKFIIKAQYPQLDLLGDFHQALWQAITRADVHNLAFYAWSQGDLGERLRKAGLEI